jgi:hypothetical protein
MKTRHEQALEMIVGRGKKLPHKWIAGDDEMGKVPWFRRDLRGNVARCIAVAFGLNNSRVVASLAC